MRQFARLYQQLDETTKTNDKLLAMQNYFAQASSDDAAWALFFLLGNKLKPSLPTKVIRIAAARSANIPDWLFEESYQWVGDLAETAAAMAVGTDLENNETLYQTITQLIVPLLSSAKGSHKKSRKSSGPKATEQIAQQSMLEESPGGVVQRLNELWNRYD
ncbi:MAG: hypothetical protein ACKO9Q_25405, partial [Pirellula sp.]